LRKISYFKLSIFGINFQSGGFNRIIEQGIESFFIFKEVPLKVVVSPVAFYFFWI
jgi:hypothetical protein